MGRGLGNWCYIRDLQIKWNLLKMFNIMERGIEIELDMLISMIEVMLSGPGDACEVTQTQFRQLVQNKSDGHVNKGKEEENSDKEGHSELKQDDKEKN